MRRYIYLLHRWTGIAMCVLMALWFFSGVVMLFVGYPKLTPWERLAALPTLPQAGCCIEPGQALAQSTAPAGVQRLTLTSIAGRPRYLLLEEDGRYTPVDAVSAALPGRADARAAIAAARGFKPGADARYQGLIDEDRWTHSRGLNPHRPLHIVDLDDAASTRVYVSSSTGQVVLDAPRAERYWNFAGAWLHWMYMIRQQNTDPVWTWALIGLSAAGVLSAATGLINGVWRWRFSGRYKSGQRTPYRETYMRWYHILGLVFGLVLCTWTFSGLMSMNPFNILGAQGARPDATAMQGGTPARLRPSPTVPRVLARLRAESFAPRELEWGVLNGHPFILARDGLNETRIVDAAGDGVRIMPSWPLAQLEAAARRLLPYRVASFDMLNSYDAQYFAREQSSMNGANERRLPALRAVFADPEDTWVYLDARTGQIELSADKTQRLGRWLFNFLHSWDVPVLLTPAWPRKAAIIALSIGGLLLSATAAVIALRRLRVIFRHGAPVTGSLAGATSGECGVATPPVEPRNRQR
ncbi:PepSY-associated TM region [Duganella sp. CF517]|uniref:PepSY domain-containing protein n=1 Tax=Duganella sp. CF517 TaxID=1881038 RepID=UPI0008AF1EBF|nr:PepSY domain-containing protein [Duganella sp. CF517]SEO04498.1 PepSY-associated TM region [Duganella sp. CF517]